MRVCVDALAFPASRLRDSFSPQTAGQVLLIVLKMSAPPGRVDAASVGVSVSAGQRKSV